MLPQAPDVSTLPIAVPVPDADAVPVTLQSDAQRRDGDLITLEGHVLITRGNYQVEADRIEYNQATGVLTATGHLAAHGAEQDEVIHASHGTVNLRDGTGRFYDVSGSIGLRTGKSGRARVYTVGNPFLFWGRMVVKRGPQSYDIYNGAVTSCALPEPDWLLSASHFSVDRSKARASGVVFRLHRIPVLFLPYATHPVDTNARQSGFLVPVVGQSSTRGFVIGEEVYFAINRSTEFSAGAQFYSKRGWQQSASLRMLGHGLDFLTLRYAGLLDRGFYVPVSPTQSQYVNQGGEDAHLSGRHDFSPNARVAGNVEYLSSYVFRQAFTDDFNAAVSTDIDSYAYATRARNGLVGSVSAERYQGLKAVGGGEQVRILHVPTLTGLAEEQHLGNTPLVWSGTAQITGLKRSQGTASTADFLNTNIIRRGDVHPGLSLPFSIAGLRFTPYAAVRGTWYSRSREAAPLPGSTPVEVHKALSRAAFETGMELHTPVLERTFDADSGIGRLLGRSVRHTIEPELIYRYRTGVDAFSRTLRFDTTDLLVNTNQLQYGVTQRFYLRPPKAQDCTSATARADAPNPGSDPGQCSGERESVSWRLVQQTYFNPDFGGAVSQNQSNVFDTTLELTPIAFLTSPRRISPIVSQLKVDLSDHVDLEWDMNFDTHSGRFTQSSTFVDFHTGNWFGSVSDARLDAPGVSQTSTGALSNQLNFSQLRLLAGYGSPMKPGFSIAGNVGLDLVSAQPQYATAQVSYNWNCCGITGEYRKFELGSVRNENLYRFSFTLANIGTAGNLRKAERLF